MGGCTQQQLCCRPFFGNGSFVGGIFYTYLYSFCCILSYCILYTIFISLIEGLRGVPSETTQQYTMNAVNMVETLAASCERCHDSNELKFGIGSGFRIDKGILKMWPGRRPGRGPVGAPKNHAELAR